MGDSLHDTSTVVAVGQQQLAILTNAKAVAESGSAALKQEAQRVCAVTTLCMRMQNCSALLLSAARRLLLSRAPAITRDRSNYLKCASAALLRLVAKSVAVMHAATTN